MTASSVERSATPSPDQKPYEKFDAAKEAQKIRQKRVKELQKFRDSREGKALVDWVRSSHRQAKDDRTIDERKWALNLAMSKGRSDLFIFDDPSLASSQAFGRIGKLPHNSKWAKKINRIRPILRTEMSRLISQEPTAFVVPASSEDDDLFAAQAGEQAWMAIKERRNFNGHFAKTAYWLTITGTSFIKTYWDTAEFDRDAGVYGDIVFATPSPFHIFVPDLLEQDIEDQPYVIHAYAKPIEWVKMRYAMELADVKLEPSHSIGSNIVENSVLGVIEGKNRDANSVIVYEVWVKPGGCKYLPKGGLVTVINDVIVQFSAEGLPYQHGQYPFTKFDHLPTETFYAESVVTDLIPLQREYNEIRSRINETIHKMSSLQIIAPQGSIHAAKMTNEIGQVIYYKPGLGKPEPFPLQQIPTYVPLALDRTILDMEDISGQHQVSKGQTPPGVTAATAISYLQEKDDSYMVPTYKSVERGVEKIGHQSLSLAVQFWDPPRLVKTVGDDLGFDAQLLRGSDLRSGTDLRIEAGSSLPESTSAKRAFIMDLMKMNFIEANEGLKMLEIGGTNRLIDKIRVDERQAQRENLKMKGLTPAIINQFKSLWMQQQQQEMAMGLEAPETIDAESGMPLGVPSVVPVNDYDNHQVHIEIHNRYRKTQSFELLPAEVRAEFERHIALHEQAIMQVTLQTFMNEIPSDGTEGQNLGGFDQPSAMDAQIAAAEGGSSNMMGGTENGSVGPESESSEQPPPG